MNLTKILNININFVLSSMKIFELKCIFHDFQVSRARLKKLGARSHPPSLIIE